MTLPPPGRRAAAALPCAGTRGEGSCGSGRWDPAAAPRVAEPPLPGRWLRSAPAPAPPPGTGALGLRRHRSILSALLSLSVRRPWGLLCRELAVCRALPGSRQRGRSLCERELCSPPVMDGDRVEIDGGIMEGGGQILRVSTALSCLLGLPLRVRRIRAGRSQPGLRPQHLSGLEIIRDLCEGKLEGGEIGSTEITFTPGKIKGGTHIADTKTAGSVCLLMQVAMPCVLFAASPSELHLKGGTNAEMAPQIDYTVMVFKPIIEKFNFTFNCDIKKRGYYPQGGGEVVVQMSPVKELSPINLTERGTVTKIYGRAFVAGALPIKLAKDMSAAAVRCIRKEIRDLYINIQPVREPDDQAFGTGSGIIIVAETSTGCLLAGSSLGKRGKNSDKVGIEAAEILLRNLKHGGTVDDSLQDQLIIFMALAKGVSRVKSGPITLHTQTAIHFAEQLTKAKFTVTKSEEEDPNKDTYIIECQGMGMINPNL